MQLSQWLVRFAQDHGLSYFQDDLFNVIIYKPASAGYEDHPALIIQAHMDMVCEKVPESTHNFETDPLELYVEGDHLRAKGTTLGADDGMGCAYMLAILDDKTLAHPPLECCFTTQEEVGLTGALHLKPEYFKARQLINLDGAGEYKTYMSMGGGKRIALKKEIHFESVDEPTYRLKVSGLLGGHSGGMIDKERANANKLVARVLYHLLLKDISLQLVSFNGGAKLNVITPHSEAVFTCTTDKQRIQAIVDACANDISMEYEFSDPDIQISLMEETQAAQAMPAELSKQVIEFVYLLPYGMKSKSMVLENLPIASVNLGIVATHEGYLELAESMRSAFDSWIVELQNEIILLAKLFDATYELGDAYPGWRYEKVSPLREKMCVAFEELYHQPLACLAGHGGNECGVFKKMHPDMDIVTSGAIYGSIHTTDEFLDLASFDRSYKFLTYFLSRL
jgi:dipeptidase D